MKKLLRVVGNKYLITGVAFGIWMLFFDQNDYGSQMQRRRDLKAADDNIAYLNKEIAGMEKDYADITTDPQKLEQYAREHYRMKKDNEDVYMVDGRK